MTLTTDAPKTILIVEDDISIRQIVKKIVAAMDCRVIEASTVTDAIDAASKYKPDVVILDLGLPDGDGTTFIDSYRSWTTNPVLILSARSGEHDKVVALDKGADDYLTKPFGTAELMARLRVMFRRANSNEEQAVHRFGDITADLSKGTVKRGEEDIHLTAIEQKLLHALLKNSGAVVTRQQLLKSVWGNAHSEDSHYLRIYMGHLRHKLEIDPAQPQYLLTETGIGYRFVSE